MRYNHIITVIICLALTSCLDVSTSVDAYVGPAASVNGYLSASSHDRFIYVIDEHETASATDDLLWKESFQGSTTDSAEVRRINGPIISSDIFRVVLSELFYNPLLSGIGARLDVSANTITDIQKEQDDVLLFDRNRPIDVAFPLVYNATTIGTCTLKARNVPVQLYGRSITVDRYILALPSSTDVTIDIEPGNTIVRSVSVTRFTSEKYKVRTSYFKRSSRNTFRVIEAR